MSDKPLHPPVLRLGAYAGIVGSLAGMVGNLIHPATPLHDPTGVAQAIAASDAWTAIHLVIIAGIALMLGGLLAIYLSIGTEPARSYAHLGWAAAIVGVAIGLILVILDGVGAKQLADQWAAAPPSEQPFFLRDVLANE